MKGSHWKKSTDGCSFRCYIKLCRKELSIRHGTFVYQSQLSLYQILKIMYFWSIGMCSQDFLMKECSIKSTGTVVDWKNFMRDICLSYFIHNPIKVGAQGIKVHIDRSHICKKKFGVGRILQNQLVWIVRV